MSWLRNSHKRAGVVFGNPVDRGVGGRYIANMKRKQQPTKEWITRTEVAKRLEMSPMTVSNWAERGVLEARYHKLGKGKGRPVYFDWADVCRRLKIPS